MVVQSQPISRGMKFSLWVFPYIFILVGAVVLFAGGKELIYAKDSASWPSVPGQITGSSIETLTGNDGVTYKAVISYRYPVNGAVYEGKRVAYGDHSSSDYSHANKIAMKYIIGREVKVFYKPDKPRESLLETGIKPQVYVMLAIGLLFFVIGVFAAVSFPKAIARFCGPRKEFDTSVISDPLARQVSWIPVNPGGFSITTHNLKVISPLRAEFRVSPYMWINVAIGVIGMLSAVAAAVLVGFGKMGKGFPLATFMSTGSILVLAVMAVILAGIFRPMFKPVIFDKSIGYCWKGKKPEDPVFDRSISNDCIELRSIHAIQLIPEYCSSNENFYTSYELNLVLDDAKRINIIDHGNKNKIRRDAAGLSQFLGKPVWDALV